MSLLLNLLLFWDFGLLCLFRFDSFMLFMYN
jgi:hypothetical protein